MADVFNFERLLNEVGTDEKAVTFLQQFGIIPESSHCSICGNVLTRIYSNVRLVKQVIFINLNHAIRFFFVFVCCTPFTVTFLTYVLFRSLYFRCTCDGRPKICVNKDTILYGSNIRIKTFLIIVYDFCAKYYHFLLILFMF